MYTIRIEKEKKQSGNKNNGNSNGNRKLSTHEMTWYKMYVSVSI